MDVVASTFLVAEGNGAVAVHLDINEGIGAHLVAATGGNLLLLQLVLEGRLEFGGVQSAVGLVEQLQLPEVQRDLLIAILQSKGAAHGAQRLFFVQLDRLAFTNGAQPRGVVGIPGGLGQLSHGVEHNGAAALAGGAHQIGIGPVGGGEDRVVEEAGAEQVGGGGVVGHILAGKLHQLVGDALIGGLLPLEHGTVLPQLCNFLLVPLYHALDHGLGVHSAGQAGNDVAVSDPIDAGRGTTAHKAGDRCHAAHSFQRAT